MRAHTLRCPIDNSVMLRKNKEGHEMTVEDWNLYEREDILRYMTYEMFFINEDDSEQDILRETLEQQYEDEDGMLELIAGIFSPVKDRAYERQWRDAIKEYDQGDGNLKNTARFLLYGCDDRSRRTHLMEDTPFADQNMSETEVLLHMLTESNIRFSFNRNDGYRIDIEDPMIGGEFAYLKPCCPLCHTILPDNWFSSIGYYTIGLVAPQRVGKTTLITSWMINNYDAFNLLSSMGPDITVRSGIASGEKEFAIQASFEKAAEKLERYGMWPKSDEKAKKPPVYMHITHRAGEVDEETFLVGIYDLAGEGLNKHELQMNGRRFAHLNFMDSLIYLIEPGQLDLDKSEFIAANYNVDAIGEYIIQFLQQQGLYQADRNPNSKEAIMATMDEPIEHFAPWYTFTQIQDFLRPKKRHIAFTLVHSDKLKAMPSMQKYKDADILFNNAPNEVAMNEEYIYQAGLIAEQLFRDFVARGNTPEDRMRFMENFLKYAESISWHVVSAAKEPMEGVPYRYEYIRKTDCLIGCILPVLKDLGWHN